MNDKMQIARGKLGLYAGFWLALASKMQWEPKDDCPGGVAATNGQYVWYNPTNINARPLGEVVFIALHEVGHPMLCHLTRMGNRDPQIYGVAIDIVLNHLLAQVATETPSLGMVVPPDATVGASNGFTDAEITTVEEVYEKLASGAKKRQGGGGFGQFDHHDKPTTGDGAPLTEAQLEAHERDWKVAVQAAATMAKQMGKLPGFLEQFVSDLLAPKVDWRTQLWTAATRVTKDESSYRRFNRRHISRGTYLPGRRSERLRAVAYFCDTSGSISTDEFKQAMGEMTALLEDLKPERIYFGQCDTQLHVVDELTPDMLPLPGLQVHGRGGTDMAEAFQWACEHEADIDVFILQPDGFVPPLSPDLHPTCPVIIIKTQRSALPAGWDFRTIIEVQV